MPAPDPSPGGPGLDRGSIRAEFISAAVWLAVLIAGVGLVGLLTADPAPGPAPSSRADP